MAKNSDVYAADKIENAFQDFCLDSSCEGGCRVALGMGRNCPGKSISECFEIWKGLEYVPESGMQDAGVSKD